MLSPDVVAEGLSNDVSALDLLRLQSMSSPPRGLVPSAKQAQSVPPTEPASDVPERPRSVTSECTDGNMCGMFAG